MALSNHERLIWPNLTLLTTHSVIIVINTAAVISVMYESLDKSSMTTQFLTHNWDLGFSNILLAASFVIKFISYSLPNKLLGWLKILLYFGVLVCGVYITWLKQLKQWKLPTVFGSIVEVSVLTCALLHCMCDLKDAQINMQHCLIQEFILWVQTGS